MNSEVDPDTQIAFSLKKKIFDTIILTVYRIGQTEDLLQNFEQMGEKILMCIPVSAYETTVLIEMVNSTLHLLYSILEGKP